MMTSIIFIYYLPLQYQAVRNHSPVHAALDILPFMAAGVALSVVSGVLASSFGRAYLGKYTSYMYAN